MRTFPTTLYHVCKNNVKQKRHSLVFMPHDYMFKFEKFVLACENTQRTNFRCSYLDSLLSNYGKVCFFCDQEQKIYHHAKFHKKSEIVGFMLHFFGSIDLE